MRFRHASPLLLLLLPTLAAADLDSPKNGRLHKRDSNKLTKEEIMELNVAKGQTAGRGKPKFAAPADGAQNPKPSTSTRPYVGTEDAPVDGLDGKPHAGPFVDTTPEETTKKGKGAAAKTSSAKPRPTSLEKFKDASNDDGWALDDIPEKNDGVMNDESRVAPKKGTTGTEGGISEKTKDRLRKGDPEKKPQAPNEAPPLPHKEQERIAEHQEKTGEKKKTSVAGKEDKDSENGAETGGKKGDEYGAGGLGMEKPTDLPEKPHNIPHPERKGSSNNGASEAGEPPIANSGQDDWLQDTMPYTEGSTNPRKNAKSASAAAGGDSTSGITSPGTAGDTEWHEWFHSFVLSMTMILFSEIGDKTFLVAALMAMRHDRLLVFTAALSALVAMTVLSAVLGHAVPTLLPKKFTTFGAAVLFLVFGARLLKEGLEMPSDSGVGEEMREVEAELEEKEHSSSHRPSSNDPYSLESGRHHHHHSSSEKRSPSASSSRSPSPSSRHATPSVRDRLSGLTNLLSLVLSPVWVQTFVMTFLGEWGDRSQIATIAMAAGQDYWWVTLGAICGHSVCTGLAVVGGRALAGKVSMRVVTIGGAVAFLAFGLIYIYECLMETS